MSENSFAQVLLLYRQEKYDEALVLVDRLAATDSLDEHLLVFRGRLVQLSAAGGHALSDAPRYFLEALERNSRSTEALLELGWYFLNVADDADEAEPYFERALALIDDQRKEATSGREKCRLDRQQPARDPDARDPQGDRWDRLTGSPTTVFHLIVFIVVSCLAGLGGTWLAGLKFWEGFLIGAGALFVNALAAEWEDRASKTKCDNDKAS